MYYKRLLYLHRTMNYPRRMTRKATTSQKSFHVRVPFTVLGRDSAHPLRPLIGKSPGLPRS